MALNVGELYASFSIDTSGVSGSMNDITNQCNSIASGLTSTGTVLSAAVTAPVVKFAKEAYTAGTQFQAQMSKVGAISGATGDDLQALTDKALYMGSTTQWTATEAGQALEYMGMAGWSTEAMLAGLPAVMNLATAAGSDLGTTSDIVTDAMTAFGLTLSSVNGDEQEFANMTTHFADVMAQAASKSNTNVQLMGTSFKYVAPLAGTLGMSAQDCAIALGLMANAGIKGTTSGAALRNTLNGLMGTTDTTAAACETLGVSLYDEKGNVKSLREVMIDLRASYKDHQEEVAAMQSAIADLDTQLENGTITQEQYDARLDELTAGCSSFMSACVKLAGKQGLSGLLAIMTASDEDFDTLADSIDNCDGRAAEMAATMLNNAQGAVTIFQSALQGLQITLWNLGSQGFVNLVNKATEMIQSFTSLDSETQQTAIKMAGLAAALGPVMIVAGKLVKVLPKIAPALKAMMSPLGLVGAGLVLFGVAAADADNSIGKMLQTLAKKGKEKLSAFNSTVRDKISTISKRIPQLVNSITTAMNDILPQLTSAINNVVIGMMDSLAENASSIVTIGETLITGLLDGLTSAMPELIPAAANLVTKLNTAIIKALPNIVSAAGKLALAIIDGIENTDWLELGQEIVTAIQESLSSIGGIFTNLFNSAKDGVTGIDWAATGTQIVKKIFSDVSSGLTAFNTFLSNLFSQASEGISKGLKGQTGTSMRKSFVSMLTSIIQGAGNILPQIGSISSTIVKGIAGLISSIPWNDVAEDAATLGQAMVDFIVKGIDSATNVATDIVGAIGQMFTKQGAGSQILDGATTIAASLVDAIAKAIPSLADDASKIVSAIGTALSSVNWSGAIVDLTSLGNSIFNAIVAAIEGAGNVATSIVEAVGNALSGINWSDVTISLSGFVDMLTNGISKAVSVATNVGVSLAQSIGELFSKINWNDASINLNTLASSIVSGIATALSSITQGSTQIANAVADLFGKIDWESVGQTASSLAQTLIDGILTGLKNLVPDMTQLTSAIGRGIAAAGEGLGTAAGQLIGGLIKALIDLKNWEKFIEVGRTIVQGIATGIYTLGKGILEGAVSFVTNAFYGITDALGITNAETRAACNEAVTIINSAGEEIASSVGDAYEQMQIWKSAGSIFDTEDLQNAVALYNAVLANGTQQMIDGLSGISFLGNQQVVSLFQTLTSTSSTEAKKTAACLALLDLGYGNYISKQFSNGKDGVIEGAEELAAQGKEAFLSAFESLGYVIPDAVKTGLENGTMDVTEAAAEIVAAASTANDQATAEANAEATGSAVTEELSAAQETGTPEVTAATEGIVTASQVALETFPDVAALAGQEATEGMSDAIDNNASAVEDSMDTLSTETVAKAVAHLSYTQGYTIGSDFTRAIKTAIQTVATLVRSAASTMASDAKSAVSDILTAAKGNTIGYNFSDGLANGILQGKSQVVNAARNVAQAAADAAKNTLDINSPSRVARDEIGYMYDRGLVEGLLNGQSEVTSAANEVSSALHDEFYVSDPSRETVMSSSASAEMTGKEVATATDKSSTQSRELANAIAEALVSSGALNRVIMMDKKIVGEQVSGSVSKTISKSSKSSISGRSVQGVFV